MGRLVLSGVSHLHPSFISFLMSVAMRPCIDANLIEHSQGK